MQGAVQLLMQPEDLLEMFSRLGVEDPDLARLTLEAGIAALVNTQRLKAIEAELNRRVDRNECGSFWENAGPNPHHFRHPSVAPVSPLTTSWAGDSSTGLFVRNRR